MKPPPFTYHRPGSLQQALELLARLGPESKVLAGGQSLVPLLNLRLARPAHIVDLNGLDDELGKVEFAGGSLRIGALVRHHQLLSDPLVARHAPMVAEAARFIGHGAVRTRGTVGGSLAHADPAAELPAVAVACDSELVVRGPAGERVIRARDFFESHFTTALRDDELLVEWHLPAAVGARRWGFAELARRHGDFAIALVAVALDLAIDGTIGRCRIVAGAVSSTPVLLPEAATVLVGSRPEPATLAAAGRAAAVACNPSGDVHASAEYRRAMVDVLVKRALAEALGRTQLEGVDLPRATSPGFARRSPLLPPLLDANGPVVVPLRVNGHPSAIAVPARRTLADALRDELGLTGTHLGCEHGVCGACTVLLDDRPVRSCLTLAVQAEARDVTTIEGVAAPGAQLHPVQQAFRDHHGLQCGFCTPGMVLSAIDLLRRIPDPTEQQVREELAGNLCRCTGYVKVVESVLAAARAQRDS